MINKLYMKNKSKLFFWLILLKNDVNKCKHKGLHKKLFYLSYVINTTHFVLK